MTPKWIAVSWAAVMLLVVNQDDKSQLQRATSDFQKQSGVSVFWDGGGKIIGMEIPGYGNGFERSIVIADSMKRLK